MSQSTKRRLAALEQVVGNQEQNQRTAIDAEWTVLSRTRLEGGSVWAGAGGHVLWPLDSIWTRKTYVLMIRAQEEGIRKLVSDTLHFCAQNDPYMLDANYPLLEYFLWMLLYICTDEKGFRPFTIHAEICRFLLAIKSEESLHYRPCDWCYECGYGYPASLYGASHDIKAFMKTRYSPEQISAMCAPFRGQACLWCGGEIVAAYARTNRWQDSPAHRLRQAKRGEWQAEIDAVELPDVMQQGRFVPLDGGDDRWEAAKADFLQRREKQKAIRVEHRPRRTRKSAALWLATTTNDCSIRFASTSHKPMICAR